MGSSASKIGRAAPAAARRYPSWRYSGKAPPNLRPADQSTRQSRQSRDSSKKGDEAKADGSDPDFAPADFSQRLYGMGMVQPNATFSPSLTARNDVRNAVSDPSMTQYPPTKQNATLSVLEARRYLQQQANDDIAKIGLRRGQHKRFIDMRTLIDTMKLRDQGMPYTEIEERHCLEPGTVRKLGRHGVFSYVSKTR
ncbi:hypothetical protein J3459_016114 [Metarhizium acridum]|uniref:Helix-turn-helix domain-containing protein n=1 Tax=Metarhizium acridum (strain CQMa 102) TaxID=655827 RepID=E9DW83_METAQ|nr:uncharacterized protein MAC_01881 [Metarhizium acridum CQMa 102]EFY91933.1 hypothetical protein MAC_01881 [Metarhizium acridum CQMa 102]KAG8411975.1 hypothetical protein J3459_016114 [Metarhizium acridum]KAG8421914.1 hypothetical protein J3458_003747 [Metarhizium acridum]